MRVIYGPPVLHEIAMLIDNATRGTRLRLLTGYFKPDAVLNSSIVAALERGVEVTVVTRGGRSRRRHREAIGAFVHPGMTARYVPWLHGKLYISETQAIASSMNLTENTNSNSGDMAVSVRRDEDPDGYQQLRDAFAYFERRQPEDELEKDVATVASAPTAKVGSVAKGDSDRGTCIRCEKGIPLDAKKPLCRPCYEEWAEYENGAYEESYCHRCGAEADTCLDKPLCKPCWAVT
ncbi:MAG TPA: phospholipase D-like domain-containing protein [Polyangiaceae bacterium]|jgi:phosphatidylserine/phosphatidylglycerophosphate/cardiolipin synthase-like enzyme|nr:phospholipase D-like domain-containing protein [Polyangiaceae bacterium]